MPTLEVSLIVGFQLAFDTALQFGQLERQLLIPGQQLAQFHKGAYHINRYFSRPRAVQDSCRHNRPMFGK